MKQYYYAIAIMLVVLLGQVGLAKSVSGDRHELNHVRHLFVDGKYEETIQELEKSIQSETMSSDGYYLLGHAYLKMDRLKDARRAFVEVVKSGHWASDVFDRLAYIDKREKRELCAMVSLGLAMVLDPGNLNYGLVLADEAVAAGRLEFAHAVYLQLVGIHPSEPGLHLRRGDLYLKQKDPRSALLAFQVAYHLGQRSRLNVRNIAELHGQLDHFEEAISWYDKLVENETETPGRIRLRQAELLFEIGDMARSRDKAGMSIDNDTGEKLPGARFLLGHIAMKEGNMDLAIHHWEKAMDDPVMHGKIGEIVGKYYSSRGKHEKAIPHLQMAMRSNDADASVLRTLVGDYLKANNIEKSMSALTLYVEKHGLDEHAQSLAKQISAAESGDSEMGKGE